LGVDARTETAEHRKAYREMLRDPSVKASVLDKVFSVAALDPGMGNRR
jgi:hypothetical protein